MQWLNTASSLAIMRSSRAPLVLIHIVCFGFFFYQFSFLISGYLSPGPDRLHTVLENKNLSEANLSLVFKVCYSPSYDLSVLNAAGYRDDIVYFVGVNESGSSDVIGWAGKNKTADIAGM